MTYREPFDYVEMSQDHLRLRGQLFKASADLHRATQRAWTATWFVVAVVTMFTSVVAMSFKNRAKLDGDGVIGIVFIAIGTLVFVRRWVLQWIEVAKKARLVRSAKDGLLAIGQSALADAMSDLARMNSSDGDGVGRHGE